MKAKWAFVLLALAGLPGCSATNFAYNNADTYLRWQADRYLDVQDEQSEELDRRLGAFLGWHRAKALPQYARLGEEAAARMLRGIKREDLEWSYDALRAQAREALGVAAGEAAALLDGLSPAQISRLERRLAEDNRKFAKAQVQGTMEERQKRRFKRNLDRLEEWFGPLSDAQEARVRRYAERVPYYAELQERDRKRRQAELLAMLRAREAKKRLVPWLQDWEAGREPAYVAATRTARNEMIDLLVDLDRTLSPAQREHVVTRLKRYASDFASLSRQ